MSGWDELEAQLRGEVAFLRALVRDLTLELARHQPASRPAAGEHPPTSPPRARARGAVDEERATLVIPRQPDDEPPGQHDDGGAAAAAASARQWAVQQAAAVKPPGPRRATRTGR